MNPNGSINVSIFAYCGNKIVIDNTVALLTPILKAQKVKSSSKSNDKPMQNTRNKSWELILNDMVELSNSLNQRGQKPVVSFNFSILIFSTLPKEPPLLYLFISILYNEGESW